MNGVKGMDPKGVNKCFRTGCIMLCWLCLSFSLAGAQQPAKRGVYKTHYSNGKAREISWYKKGALVRRKVFYEDGALLRDEIWRNDVMELKREYTPEGRVSGVWDYKAKKITLYNKDGSFNKAVPLKLQAPWKQQE